MSMRFCAFVATLIVSLSAFSIDASAQMRSEPDGRGIPTIAPVIKEITDGVVNISARAEQPLQINPLFRDPLFRDFFDLPDQLPDMQRASVGSGVIVDASEGYVLTNHHVIAGADTILVTLRDRREVAAELVGSDPGTDIAVLRVPADDLSGVPLGTSDRLLVGDYVVAVGNPFGIGQTVTLGIVSALGRSGINPQGYEDFIQTDASINPGNSGGALITLDGRLVGINTAIVSRSGGNVGIGFAVPIDMARSVMEQIVEYGEVRRGQLGVTVRDLTADLAVALDVPMDRGAVVVDVLPGSAAEDTGLMPGDVVTAIDGAPVDGARDLRNRIGTLRPGSTVAITVQRGSQADTFEVVLSKGKGAASPVPVAPGTTPPALSGALVETLGPDHPAHGTVDGVVVVEVAPGSAAARAGLQPGDVITHVDRQPVASKAEFDARIAAAADTIALTLWRDGRRSLAVIEGDA